MSAREEKARQYIESGRFIARQYFKYDVKNAYLDGWDDAMEHVKGLVGKMAFEKIMECNKDVLERLQNRSHGERPQAKSSI